MIDKTFRAGEKFRPVRTETRKMQFLYESATTRDHGPERLRADALPKASSASARLDRSPTTRSTCCSSTSSPPTSRCRAPSSWRYKTDPGVRGDTASGGGDKPATLESGVTVKVPLFVNEGDRVEVDTRTGEYMSRA